MKILVGCEESQAVTIELRKLGHEAFSCDLLPCSGGYPEWHIQGDVLKEAYSGRYDMGIFFPPCTFMSRAGARWMYPTAGNLCPERLKKAMDAKDFFLKLKNAPIDKISLENPLPLKIVGLPKESQTIQPYQFGHEFSKRTLLWLKNLPKLKPTDIKEKYVPYLPSNTGGKKRGQKATFKNISQIQSSKTFPGIAKALAVQFTCFVESGKTIKEWESIDLSEKNL
jgi:hypothetical protein